MLKNIQIGVTSNTCKWWLDSGRILKMKLVECYLYEGVERSALVADADGGRLERVVLKESAFDIAIK